MAREYRVPIVFDNPVHQRRMPVTIGILIRPRWFPPVAPDQKPISNRGFEYDTLNDPYVRLLLEEILPGVARLRVRKRGCFRNAKRL
jgi:enterochelin esterase family protein